MEQQHGKKVLSKLQKNYPHIFGKGNNNQNKKPMALTLQSQPFKPDFLKNTPFFKPNNQF